MRPAQLVLEGVGLGQRRLGTAHVEERLLGHLVEIAVDQGLERLDGLLHGNGDALQTGEHLADVERLGQEPLDLPGPGDGDPVLLGQLVEAEDGDDVLELLVALEDALDPAGHVVVAVAHDLGGQDVRGGRQRVDGRIDP